MQDLFLHFTGGGICFLLNGISYLFVIASLVLMKVTPRKINRKNTHVLKEMKEGFSYAFGFVPMKYFIFLLSLVSLMGMQYTVLMPVFAKEILHGGSHTFGFLLGASELGALTGALYLASRKNVMGLFRIIPLAAGIFGFGLITLSFSRFFLLSLALMVIVGLGMMLQMASSNTILQTIVDDDKRGRVSRSLILQGLRFTDTSLSYSRPILYKYFCVLIITEFLKIAGVAHIPESI